MRLLEHQGKSLLSRFGLRFNAWATATDAAGALAAAEKLGFPVVIKAQVPVGGRAKAGAVRFADNADSARREIHTLFSMRVGAHPVAAEPVHPPGGGIAGRPFAEVVALPRTLTG